MVRKNRSRLFFRVSKKQKLEYFEKFVIAASFIYPLTGIPQVVAVFQGKVDGVSLASWLGFICFALILSAYGVVHKIKPMIINNFLWVIVDALVVSGILIHRMAG